MAYDPGALDSTLAAAVGSDPALAAELRTAFVQSSEQALAALKGSADQEAWTVAALRLRGLAASFGALRLMKAAQDAAAAQRGELSVIRRVDRIIGGF